MTKITQKMRIELLDFAKDSGLTLVERGESGFGRPCVGFTVAGHYPEYKPYIRSGDYEEVEALCDPDCAPPRDAFDAYHKADVFCVLAHAATEKDYDEAERQLHIWMSNIKGKGGARLVTYASGADTFAAVLSGVIGYAFVTVPFWERLAENVDSLPDCVNKEQFGLFD
jgi:hypothetical protein